MNATTTKCPNGHADPIYVNDTLAECHVCGAIYDADTGEASVRTKLDRVEDGFARVLNADTGATIGYVSRVEPWKVASGTRWVATRTRTRSVVLGHGDTRTEAVEVIAKWAARFGR